MFATEPSRVLVRRCRHKTQQQQQQQQQYDGREQWNRVHYRFLLCLISTSQRIDAVTQE